MTLLAALRRRPRPAPPPLVDVRCAVPGRPRTTTPAAGTLGYAVALTHTGNPALTHTTVMGEEEARRELATWRRSGHMAELVQVTR